MPAGKDGPSTRRGGGTTKKNAFCSFCRKSYRDVGPLVEGPGDVYICGECIELCQSILDQEQRRRGSTKQLFSEIPPPREIVSAAGRIRDWADSCQKVLAVAVHNHYKRLALGWEGSDVEIEKSNILLIGPTGPARRCWPAPWLAILNVPFAIGDATTLTEAGYVGEDVENLLLKLLHAADFDIEAAQRGVLYIDEIDKIGKTTKTFRLRGTCPAKASSRLCSRCWKARRPTSRLRAGGSTRSSSISRWIPVISCSFVGARLSGSTISYASDWASE